MTNVRGTLEQVKWHVWLRFGKWELILREPLRKNKTLYPVCIATGLYAKGIANAALGRVEEAQRRRLQFTDALLRVSDDAYLHNVKSIDFLNVAKHMLDGEILFRQEEYENAFDTLRLAVTLEEELPYDEPWGWMVPVRHALGALLLERGYRSEAERVFRADLRRYPRNLWSLTGILSCLKSSSSSSAREVEVTVKQLREATKRCDVPIHAACMCARRSGDGEASRSACCERRTKRMKKSGGSSP